MDRPLWARGWTDSGRAELNAGDVGLDEEGSCAGVRNLGASQQAPGPRKPVIAVLLSANREDPRPAFVRLVMDRYVEVAREANCQERGK